jgi:hypothetical protein
VDQLVACFGNHADPAKEADRPAVAWLPGLLRFPAVKSIAEQQT